MREGLLLIERIVIESISKKEKNIYELCIDTNLDQGLMLNILPNLLMKNLLVYHRGIYSIAKENSLKWTSTINNTNNVKEEVKEIFTTLVNDYFREEKENIGIPSQLKIQKIWLTTSEEKILNGHLISIENLFKSIKESRVKTPIKEKTHEQKVVVWGLANYSSLVHGVLGSV